MDPVWALSTWWPASGFDTVYGLCYTVQLQEVTTNERSG